MPLFTTKQIEKLAETIRLHTNWFIWRTINYRLITPADLKELQDHKVLPTDISINSIQDTYTLGKLESLLKRNEWLNLGWDAAMEEAEQKTRTPIEDKQIEAIELHYASKIRGLAEDIRQGLYDELARQSGQQVTEAHVNDIIKETIKTGMADRDLRHMIARTLADRLSEIRREWMRVTINEIATAEQKGIANTIIQKEDVYRFSDGLDSDVAVAHGPNACADCLRMYTDNGKPKIFKLRELIANEGSNYNRPWRKNAKPVVPPLHPHCGGTLMYVPKGWGFDKDNLFTYIGTSNGKKI